MSDFVHDGVSIPEDRQQLLLAEWESRPSNPPSLKESVQIAFPDIEDKPTLPITSTDIGG